MTTFQKVIKYFAVAFAVFLVVCIIGSILQFAGIFVGFSGSDGVAKEPKTYSVSQSVQGLNVDISAADFKIVTGDAFSVESNLKSLTVEEKNGVLRITQKKGFGINYRNAALTLCIPAGFVFKNAEISTGAGKLTVDALSAGRLHLELGAGAAEIRELNADVSAKIDGGAGEITIAGGTLYNLDLDMGVGQLNLTAALLGSSELDYGVGETSLTLIGTKDNYRIEFDKGLGSATVDGQSMSDGSIYGNGANRIDIDGGVGAATVRFKETTNE